MNLILLILLRIRKACALKFFIPSFNIVLLVWEKSILHRMVQLLSSLLVDVKSLLWVRGCMWLAYIHERLENYSFLINFIDYGSKQYFFVDSACSSCRNPKEVIWQAQISSFFCSDDVFGKSPAFCSFPLGCLNLCVSHDLLLHLSIGKRIARIFSVCILLFHVKEKYEVLDVSC